MNATPFDAELAARWQARVQAGTFSPVVQGVGTIRIMGKSGDAPVAFPRITSLSVLCELEPDEQWAIRAAQAIVTQAQSRSRQVVATRPPTMGDVATMPTPVREFDPTAETLLVLSMTAGG